MPAQITEEKRQRMRAAQRKYQAAHREARNQSQNERRRSARRALWLTRTVNRAPDLPGERWLPVVGYESIYEVSNLGRVMRIGWGSGTKPGRIMRTNLTTAGYPSLSLSNNGVVTTYLLHGLVARAFLGPRPSDEHEANHIDGIKRNASVSNLEWIEAWRNQRHAWETGLHPKQVRRAKQPMKAGAKGTRNGHAKLTDDQVRLIREAHEHEPHRVTAARYGVSESVISVVVNRKRWTHVI